MKVMQILNSMCHWETPYHSLKECKGKYASNIIFVEAPDYVFEGWGYDSTKKGNARFVKPTPPEGWLYDDATGTFYNPELLEQQTRLFKEEQYKNLSVSYIREKYSENDEYQILRETLAFPDDAEKRAAFDAYNTYVIECKARAYREIYGEGGDDNVSSGG